MPFAKGKSGNPGGRPKKDARLRAAEDLAREHTEDAINALIAIAKDKNANERARVAAAEAILDRGWGKSVERQEQGRPGDFKEMPTEQLEQEAKQLLADAVKTGLVKVLPRKAGGEA